MAGLRVGTGGGSAETSLRQHPWQGRLRGFGGHYKTVIVPLTAFSLVFPSTQANKRFTYPEIVVIVRHSLPAVKGRLAKWYI
jgi:hypothetical protein